MTFREGILEAFQGHTTGRLPYLADLTLWYEWHMTRGTLPPAWQDDSLAEVSQRLRSPAWLPVRAWEEELSGISVETIETADERTITYETSAKRLVARWVRGPDGDWWQAEYPLKGKEDLKAGLELAESRRYTVDASTLAEARSHVGDSGVVVLELPKRPYSAILHEYLGWSEGLILLGEPEIQEMLTVLEEKLQALVAEVAQLPGAIVLSPDNLDGQFISPGAFDRYLAGSYRRTAEIVHEQDKHLVTHVGGPAARLLDGLAEAGLDGVEGICGPPQGDTPLPEARGIAGPGITLWGGIPQDVLIEAHSREQFEETVARVAEEARDDGRVVLGIADRVPVNASLDRLQAIPSLISQGSVA